MACCDGAGVELGKGGRRRPACPVSLITVHDEAGLELQGVDSGYDFAVGVYFCLGGVHSHEAGSPVFEQGSEPVSVGGGGWHGACHVG